MSKLNILWVNDNPVTAHTMVFMYAINAKAKGWWDEVELIIWGATAKLVATDFEIQEKITTALESGVKVRACVACAKALGAVEELEDLGIEVIAMGIPLSNILKDDEKLITI